MPIRSARHPENSRNKERRGPCAVPPAAFCVCCTLIVWGAMLYYFVSSRNDSSQGVWQSIVSSKSKAVLYWNTKTGEETFTKPTGSIKPVAVDADDKSSGSCPVFPRSSLVHSVIRERIGIWSIKYDVYTTDEAGTESTSGTIERRLFSWWHPKLHWYDNQGRLIASAKKFRFTWGLQVQILDCHGDLIGTLLEKNAWILSYTQQMRFRLAGKTEDAATFVLRNSVHRRGSRDVRIYIPGDADADKKVNQNADGDLVLSADSPALDWFEFERIWKVGDVQTSADCDENDGACVATDPRVVLLTEVIQSRGFEKWPWAGAGFDLFSFR